MSIRILVVDDATFIRDMIKKHLRENFPGVEVIDAINGHRAIAQLKSKSFDLVLSDWEMPEMTGEQLLHWIRNNDSYRSTPFVMVTSRGERDHVLGAVKAGVSDYIAKPFTPDELIKKTLKQLKKIGKLPASTTAGEKAGAGTGKAVTQGFASASVDILTGGLAQDKGREQAKSTNAAEKIKGKAQIRFPTVTCACVIRDLSLQSMNGLIQRGDRPPTVFDPAVVDIDVDNESIARINGYVHSVQAGENHVDSSVIKIVIRFVDKDPEKFEILSQYIARLNSTL